MRFKIEPWAHQREAMRRAEAMSEFALFFEMGAGKTATTINIVRARMNEHKRILRTLILAPPIVLDNWRSEWLGHSDLSKERVVVLRGHNAERYSKFMKNAFLESHHASRAKWLAKGCVFVTNYEALQMPSLWKELVYWSPEVVVFDEAHKLKDVHSKRTKASIKLADAARYRYILTGTPVLNNYMDLYALFRILDRGATFGHSYTMFRAKYFFDANGLRARKPGYFPKWTMKPNVTGELRQMIEAKSMRVEKKECLDLPPLVRKQVHVDLSPEQRTLYQSMLRDYIAFVSGGTCTAPLAITRMLRLLQIVSGFVSIECQTPESAVRRNIMIADNPRAMALKTILREIFESGHKAIIWAVFRDNYVTVRRVLEELEVDWVEVHGDVSEAKKRAGIVSFKTAAKCRALIAHPGSAGVGLNLQEAAYSVFYSRTFNLEHDLQAEARNHRGGSEMHQCVTRIDLVARDTIDELIHARLSAKVAMSNELLQDLGRELAGNDPEKFLKETGDGEFDP